MCGTHKVIKTVQFATAEGNRAVHLYRKGICVKCMKLPELISMSDKRLVLFIRNEDSWAVKSFPGYVVNGGQPQQHYGSRFPRHGQGYGMGA